LHLRVILCSHSWWCCYSKNWVVELERWC